MRGIAVLYDFGNVFSGDADGEALLRIQPQVVLGGARVDFLITLQKISESDGLKIWRKQLVIECDGANFHDRLPAQGVRDRKRDRALVALGLQVLRFSGSEIWKDSFECATQALDLLLGCVDAQQEVDQAPARKAATRASAFRTSNVARA